MRFAAVVRGFARVFGLSSVLALGVLSPRNAEAAPNAVAEDEMYWAFSACSKGLDARFDEEKHSAHVEYKERRAKAVKADASITSFTGKTKGRYAVPEWLKKCDVDLAKVAAEAGKHQQAEVHVRQASFACSDGKKGDEAALAKFSALKARALETYPAIANEPHGATTATIGQFFAACEKEIPAAIESRKKHDADVQKFQDDGLQKAREASAKAEADDAKHEAQMKKVLKGDRLKIWGREGDPSDFPGTKIQLASYWEYEVTPSGTSMTCTVKYAFKGNKLVRKSKSGTGCILVD